MQMHMSLINAGAAQVTPVAAVSWVPQVDMGTVHPAGHAAALDGLPDAGLAFVLSQDPAVGSGVLHGAPSTLPEGPAMLRIDEVCFPVGAIAHRHTHQGAGLRYLIRGSLRIEAADHTQVMNPGDIWFEPSNTPVRAVALQSAGVTSFVRAMVIPASFAGKSTFSLVDTADAALPRLQMTHRHLDLPLQFDAG
jgi:quercetin dioxygenase-like cupin family protein